MFKSSLVGKKFGRLTVLARARAKQSRRGTFWLCDCECGKKKIIRRDALIGGLTTSCGCFCLERLAATRGYFKHGHAKSGESSREYRSWQAMKNRCLNPNDGFWKDYGGRGITVCDRWKYSFSNFLKDLGPRPPKMQLGRLDNNKGYSPKNCRWASSRINSNNKRNNRKITFRQTTLTVTEWARRLGMPIQTLFSRIRAGRKLPSEMFNGYA